MQARKLRHSGSNKVDAAPEAVARGFIDFWRNDGERHFEEEEQILLPIYARYGDVADPAIVRMLTDHVKIRRGALDIEFSLKEGLALTSLELRPLGELLDDHIRHEEQTVFPRIQEALPETDLRELAARLAAFGSGERR